MKYKDSSTEARRKRYRILGLVLPNRLTRERRSALMAQGVSLPAPLSESRERQAWLIARGRALPASTKTPMTEARKMWLRERGREVQAMRRNQK